MKGMASQESLGSHNQASGQSVFDDGFIGVVCASREKTAMLSQQGREAFFIYFDQE
jgi:hypothetical protein